MRTLALVSAAACFLMPLAAPLKAWATTFVNRPLSEAVAESPNIVRGKTGDGYSNWDKEHKRIFTYTHFKVTDVLKGTRRRIIQTPKR